MAVREQLDRLATFEPAPLEKFPEQPSQSSGRANQGTGTDWHARTFAD